MTRARISFEFFPPQTLDASFRLWEAVQVLAPLDPDFVSVTYGAGGSTHAGTFATVSEILEEGVAAASHFSCIGATRQTVREQLETLKSMGVQRLVALRGDLPSGYGAGGEFQYASSSPRCKSWASNAWWHCAVICPAAMAQVVNFITRVTWWRLSGPRRAMPFTLKWPLTLKCIRRPSRLMMI